ncbi:hypothetical protein ABLO26_11185 [Neobacillus sp. 179-J 1A1 HS]|uniref:hypothetical protein n=1 Tax=Neobacillus driksii TaxID=3035913 RepID=UPI00277F6CAC|nr:hypothetical protein [Neobacillus niacini]MDQ0973377.1 putative membrane protein YesL [Neobacillus niacini]
MKKGVVSIMESKFLGLIDLIYQLVKSSFFFWITLVKSFVFFGLTTSFCTMLKVMEEILLGNGTPTRILYKEISSEYKGYKGLSLVTSFLLIYFSAFIIIPLPNSISSNTASIIKFSMIYLFLLTLVLFTYISWILVNMDLTLKKSIMFGFYLMIKRFFRTIILILMMIVLFSVSYKNFIFFIFLAPAIYANGVKIVLKKLVV